ncbi:MAG: alkyl hydroperoxide reductase [Ponticaulis sp.]|nr:alkyl hydroperoxide reductase [Ponticaulis sp.]|tara:strand:- start:38354 stop:39616 length:1263 start_codon:yes stop_codon:yes gene_type:complete
MDSYQTVQGWAPMIREVIRTDRMPPWHADPEIGTFHADRSLTNDEIKTLVHWVEAGAPRGEGEDPLQAVEHVAPDWPLGEPDLLLTLPAYTVPANGVVDYVHPIVENPLTEDKWLKATTIRAGNRQVVHHVLSGYMSEVPEDGVGSTSRWEFSTGGYAVGAESNVAPENSGVPFPAGGAIGFQVHYTPYGKEVEDVTQIGFYFQDQPELLNRTAVILDASIEIPPGAARHTETAYMEFPYDAELLSAFPHAHYRGYASNLRIRYPDGSEEMLLSLPRYDFNWQRGYEWEEPIAIPAGSKLIADYTYDNSKSNDANPDPNAVITWGDQSFEEMLYTSLSFRFKGETTDNRLDNQMAELDETRMFTAMDDNIDGRLTTDELKGMLGQRMKAGFDRMDMNSDGAVDLNEYVTINRLLRARGQQ